MTGPISTYGWAVDAGAGPIVRTVHDTRRGAIVNWLYSVERIPVLASYSDTYIEEMWERFRGMAVLREVEIRPR